MSTHCRARGQESSRPRSPRRCGRPSHRPRSHQAARSPARRPRCARQVHRPLSVQRRWSRALPLRWTLPRLRAAASPRPGASSQPPRAPQSPCASPAAPPRSAACSWPPLAQSCTSLGRARDRHAGSLQQRRHLDSGERARGPVGFFSRARYLHASVAVALALALALALTLTLLSVTNQVVVGARRVRTRTRCATARGPRSRGSATRPGARVGLESRLI